MFGLALNYFITLNLICNSAIISSGLKTVHQSDFKKNSSPSVANCCHCCLLWIYRPATYKKEMKSHVSRADEDDCESCMVAYCWWRRAAQFDVCAKFKLDFPDVSILTPRIRLLRELERLALIAPDGLNELRHKLLGYRSGDFWVPTGGINKEDMNIPSVNTILLVGFSGSGKSSLINLMYSVLGRSGIIPFAQTSSGGNCSNYTTMYLEEHNVLRSLRSGFCVYDSRGFDYGKTREALDEISEWMSEGIHHNQLCFRNGDYEKQTDDTENVDLGSSSKFAQRRVNCVIVVANVAEIYKALKAGDMKPLEATRQIFCSPALRKSNENPLLILTHGDLLSTEERLDGRLKICERLDISESNGVYDVVCLTEYGFVAEEYDPVSAYALTEVLYRALLISDRGHFPKRKFKDWTLFTLAWIVRFIGACFAFLADVFSKLGDEHKLRM